MSSIAAAHPSVPSWLPNPVTEAYIQMVASELLDRESNRGDCHSAIPKEPAYAPAYRTSVAMLPINVRCNRYMDVVPYDKSRVVLSTGAYINASWVKELAGGKWTIATQAPLDRTAHSFLSMFLVPITPPGSTVSPPPTANRLRTIVQLTPNMEGRLTKAFPYFPSVIGEEMIWPTPKHDHSLPIKVKLLEVTSPEEEGKHPSWKHSVLGVSYDGSGDPPHLVRHLHFLVSQTSTDFENGLMSITRAGRTTVFQRTYDPSYSSCSLWKLVIPMELTPTPR